MKIKIDRVEQSKYTDKDGNPKYSVFDGNGEKHTSTDSRLKDKVGQVVEVEQQTGVYQGKNWSKITLKEEIKEEVKTDKVPNEVWERKDRWQAKESAWKSASSVYQGTGEAVKVAKLAQDIYESITDEEWKIKLTNGFGPKKVKDDEETPRSENEDKIDIEKVDKEID